MFVLTKKEKKKSSLIISWTFLGNTLSSGDF